MGEDGMRDMLELLGKAGYEVISPENMKQLCCGTIWESKGMPDIADQKTAELFAALQKASNNWEYPILCDQSPCLYRMREYAKQHPISAATAAPIMLYEPAEFIAEHVIDKVDITPLPQTVAIHYTCSTRKMNLCDTLLQLTKRCAAHVLVPEEVGCCAFAGDKGFTSPELNKWALRKLRKQIEEGGVTLGVSNSRTCEIGLCHHSGVQYVNIATLVNSVAQRLTN